MGADIVGWRNCQLQSELGAPGFLSKLKLRMYRGVFETQVPPAERDLVRIMIRVTGRADRELGYRDVVAELASFESGIPECPTCPLSGGKALGCYRYVTFPVDEVFEQISFQHFCADAALQGSPSWQIAQNVIPRIPARGTAWHQRRALDAEQGGLAVLARPLEATIGWQRVDSAQVMMAMFITLDSPGPLSAYASFYTGLIAYARQRGALDASRSLTEVAQIEPLYRIASSMAQHGYSIHVDA